MDISSAHCCSRWARGGQRALILSAQDLLHPGFLRWDCKVGKWYHPEAAPVGLIKQNGSGLPNFGCAPGISKKEQRLGWVLAATAAPGRSAGSEERGESGFSSAPEPSFGAGMRIFSCSRALRSFMCLGSATHSCAALQRSCDLSSKRNNLCRQQLCYFFFFHFYWSMFVY